MAISLPFVAARCCLIAPKRRPGFPQGGITEPMVIDVAIDPVPG
jgi:hypothetical protein